MSSALTEWVSAPTEMKSTPVAATSRDGLQVDAARGLQGHAAVGHPDRLAHLVGRHVVEQDAVDRQASAPRELVQVGHLDLDRAGRARIVLPAPGAPPR